MSFMTYVTGHHQFCRVLPVVFFFKFVYLF